jgi:hypothetical protein
MTAQEFYESRVKATNWSDDNLCSPPTDPRQAVHILIDQFLGEDWYSNTPQNDDQCITEAVYYILKKHPRPEDRRKKLIQSIRKQIQKLDSKFENLEKRKRRY